MRPIKFIFTAGTSLPSRLIRYISGQPYSHVAIELDWNELGSRVVVESTWPNERPEAADLWRAQHRREIALEVTPDWDFSSGLPVLLEHMASSYDVSGLIGMVWVFLIRRFGHKRIKNPLNDPSRDFCSELAVALLKAAHYPGAESIPALTASPGDVADLLRKVEDQANVKTF